MSQHAPSLHIIEKESNLTGKIVRPLSAGLLPPTDAEKDGLIKRENLGMIKGRQRKIQIQMAKEYGIENPPNAGGGCLLTEPQFGIKAKESELQTILMTYAMEQDMFDTGYKSTLNPLIIAGGPNGALPHAQVTNRKFKKGDLVVADLTLRYKGYVSDATRTFALGKISSQANEAYEIVKESQRLGLKAVRPNIDCKDIDFVCRKYIDDHNYGKYFIHSTGHGIGLEVHELPCISYRSNTKLKENMAITVEPGIYIENKFGIRIEDSLIVKERPIVMHKFTKDLVTI